MGERLVGEEMGTYPLRECRGDGEEGPESGMDQSAVRSSVEVLVLRDIDLMLQSSFHSKSVGSGNNVTQLLTRL